MSRQSSAARVFTHQWRRADQDYQYRVENPNLHDLAIKDVPILNGTKLSARV